MLKLGLCLILLLFQLSLGAELLPGTILGFQMGYSLAQHYGTVAQTAGYEVKTAMHLGITSGVTLQLPITKAFMLMYELNYVTKGSSEKITIKELEDEALVKPAIMNVEYGLDYLTFPVLFKLRVVDAPKLRLSTVGGAEMALKVHGKYTLDGIIYFPETDGYSTIYINDKSKLDEVNMFDFALIYGGEMDFWIKKLPLTLVYRFTLGWDYIDLPTFPEGGFAPVSLRNQSYVLAVKLPFSLTK